MLPDAAGRRTITAGSEGRNPHHTDCFTAGGDPVEASLSQVLVGLAAILQALYHYGSAMAEIWIVKLTVPNAGNITTLVNPVPQQSW
jgi:hypothetical protein